KPVNEGKREDRRPGPGKRSRPRRASAPGRGDSEKNTAGESGTPAVGARIGDSENPARNGGGSPSGTPGGGDDGSQQLGTDRGTARVDRFLRPGGGAGDSKRNRHGF